MTTTVPTIDAIRDAFPALTGDTILLENAGGSQVPRCVADRIRDHFLNDYVQLGAGYPMSDRATATVNAAHEFVEMLVNGAETGRAILGSSCTSLTYMLSDCIGRITEAGDEIVLCTQGHEANVGPWLRLAERGAVIRWWDVNPETGSLDLEDLAALLGERTRIVAFPHVSNLLGEIVDARAVADLAHAHGAQVVVDGVAYAPHRPIDVNALAADFYIYSTYKVYGPHMGALWGRNDALARLDGPNHFFIPRTDIPYVFELGGPSHEGCAGILALGEYLRFLAGVDAPCSTTIAHQAFDIMRELEAPVQARLIERLADHPEVRLIGTPSTHTDDRVATISFIHARHAPGTIVKAAHDAGVGIRHGHMYAYRLCERMGIPIDQGVVRVSAVHYNTVAEIDHLMDALDPILTS
ncbi:MAG: cysteine desulfurase-like protein [Phycisphaerales bacterium]|nr:cysteine desulfurase-like protein [Phycisphaerales bacterium]